MSAQPFPGVAVLVDQRGAASAVLLRDAMARAPADTVAHRKRLRLAEFLLRGRDSDTIASGSQQSKE